MSTPPTPDLNPEPKPLDFLRTIVEQDLRAGKHQTVVTRFPPEPNGFLHVGHAKSICLNFGIAAQYGGVCHLRFDDTNPSKEEEAFAQGIMRDVQWLGFDWGPNLYHASDYYQKLYDSAEQLISAGKAYVCSLDAEQIRAYRGSLTEPGRDSPYRDRSIDENLDLFRRMRAGEFPDGAHVLRAKIDMASPNLNMRDPTLYRIRRVEHHRTGDQWGIYPMYDYAHCISDSIEGITHSMCTLEFEDHRPLYDWILEALEVDCHPQQIEFARLNLSFTVTSKRKLRELVERGLVSGWDDPRMPTLVAMRRRGYTPKSIRDFCDRVGVSKRDSISDVALLEHVLRDELNQTAPRAMAVLRPLKVVIENWPAGKVDQLPAVNNPQDASMGSRTVPFTGEIYIERDDFMEDPPRKFFRLAPGREVRLRWAYLITCTDVVKDQSSGEVIELRCTCDLDSRGGNAPDGRKVKSTVHWVSAEHALEAEVRLYDRLFLVPDPNVVEAGQDVLDNLNPDSLVTVEGAKVEPSLAGASAGDRYQFERQGYFCVDPDTTASSLVFNRTVPLRDSWAKAAPPPAAVKGGAK